MPKRLLPVARYRQQDRSRHGFPTQMLKYFRKDFCLDAYKGYHQVQMAEEDEEQTAFYTDQGTYCYTKMSFGLKNMVATYQREARISLTTRIQKIEKILRSSSYHRHHGSTKADTSRRLYKRGTGGNEVMTPRQTRYTIDHQKDCKEEWVLYTDGASSAKGSGAGLVLISPTKTEYTYALRLNFKSTNNEAEYEALLTSCFKIFKIQNIARNKNQKADVLSKLASVAFNHLTKEILVETLDIPSMDGEEINAVVKEEGETWMTPIINCLERGIWPKDHNEARALRKKMGQYVMEEGVLFKRSYLMPMLWCVGPPHANYVIREIHMGACSMLDIKEKDKIRAKTRQNQEQTGSVEKSRVMPDKVKAQSKPKKASSEGKHNFRDQNFQILKLCYYKKNFKG
nr:reverse transcriptase domain-containing protein [Tanacetum cinerariifolium]